MTAYVADYRAVAGWNALAVAVMQARRLAGTRHVDAEPLTRPGQPADTGAGDTPMPQPRPRPSHPSPKPRPASEPHTAVAPPSRSGPAPTGSSPGTDGNGASPSSGPPENDGVALVRRAQSGEAEAFGELYDRYFDLVFRYIYYRVGNRAQAEDFTSETFLRALRRIGSFTWTGRDIGAWFVTIARNIVLDHLKSSRHRLEITTADMLDEDRAEDGPEDAVLDRVTNAELLRCVRMLNPEQQECIVLRFLHGLSVAETAAIMGKNDGAIKALQHRAVRRLASLLPEDIR